MWRYDTKTMEKPQRVGVLTQILWPNICGHLGCSEVSLWGSEEGVFWQKRGLFNKKPFLQILEILEIEGIPGGPRVWKAKEIIPSDTKVLLTNIYSETSIYYAKSPPERVPGDKLISLP